MKMVTRTLLPHQVLNILFVVHQRRLITETLRWVWENTPDLSDSGYPGSFIQQKGPGYFIDRHIGKSVSSSCNCPFFRRHSGTYT